MEKSKVYFTDFRAKLGEGLPSKLKRLIRKAGTGELTEEISSFVHEITVPAEAIPEVEKQYCVSNILSDGTKARIRILAESVSGRYEASATIPTLEDVYLYHFQLREKGWSDV